MQKKNQKRTGLNKKNANDFGIKEQVDRPPKIEGRTSDFCLNKIQKSCVSLIVFLCL